MRKKDIVKRLFFRERKLESCFTLIPRKLGAVPEARKPPAKMCSF